MASTTTVLLVAGALLTLSGGSTPTARLDVTPGPSYRVAVVVESAQPISGTYSLVVERVGDAGQSRSSQGGAFDLEGGQSDTLSVSAVNVTPGDRLEARLEVEWDDGTTSSDSFERTL
ncbi:curli-like amyloid fiber formation chaperone CsgH [Rubrivirga sp.]|uniref:curli-like amyloid fiber formation chaperone CsgH n=1 Tax=Rubrivirga sp. TaxID=1885344 RepID=UPI003C75DC26